MPPQIFMQYYPKNMKSFNLAIEYAQRALSKNNKDSFAYSTLAEAYATLFDDEGFYNNLELALQYGYPAWEQLDDLVYEKYAKQTRFQKMIAKYQKC